RARSSPRGRASVRRAEGWVRRSAGAGRRSSSRALWRQRALAPKLPAAVPTPKNAEVIALARKTPLTRGRVADLAQKVPGRVARDAALEALDTAGANAAMVLAFAAISAGEKLPPEL